ncbi:hypothetical protein PL10110_240087 [Planktothrix agardhii]|nr:hypothetical protein PL10110_240087 [Planktothrix agardhii]
MGHRVKKFKMVLSKLHLSQFILNILGLRQALLAGFTHRTV